MSKRQDIISTIYKQSDSFHTANITALSGSSQALVNTVLNEMIILGNIESYKDGRKTMYKLINRPALESAAIQTTYSLQDKFESIRSVVRMVINGDNPSALITGRSGVGKTYLVKDELNKAGRIEKIDYVFMSGHSSALGLYKLLHDYRDCFIVLDDMDSAFNDPKSLNILKAALDSYNVRKISWLSMKTENTDLEPTFEFTGKIIIITNLYADSIDEALKSRSLCINLRLTDAEVTEHIRNLINDIEPFIDIGIKNEVLDYISTISYKFEAYGIRTFMQACRIRKVNEDWKKMIDVLTQK